MDKEVSEPDGQRPYHRYQGPCLGGIRGPLGEGGGDKDIGCRQPQQQPEISPLSPEHLDGADEGEKEERRVEKEAVALVKKISGQGSPAIAQGDFEEEGLGKAGEFLARVRRLGPPPDGEEGIGPVKGLLGLKIEKDAGCKDRQVANKGPG